MTKRNLLDLYQSLNKLSTLPGAKFSYAVAKNMLVIKNEMEALNEVQKPKADFIKLQKEFEPKRIEIVEKYCKKDDKGIALKKFITINGQQVEIYDMEPENQVKSNTECEVALKEMNPKIYKEREEQLNEYEKLLDEEVVLMFYKIKQENLPSIITPEQVTSIFPIIAE